MSIPVTRLNHAVLFVRDLEAAVGFYRRVFGFEEIAREFGRMAFLRAKGSENHHDLGLLALGPGAPRPPRGSTGLYHLAWEVPRIEDLAAAAEVLSREGALTGASDHGATKSVYGRDPDGNEFEIMWLVPRAEWGEYERRGIVAPLDLDRELARFGGRA
ncbi:MAG TPA: VOC family protein [Candidatus Limnocylindrales bacterium]|nr:VOC family protein [Candidatus Limnocylindrales bacterium]